MEARASRPSRPQPAPPPGAAQPPPLVLVCGDDDFAVKQRARQLYGQWCLEAGGMDHETIDAAITTSGEALRALAKLREALQTLPFFGGAKVIWFKHCSFLGDERAAAVASVTDSLNALADDLKRMTWSDVRLLISAGKVDRRRTFYKVLDQLGRIETCAGLSIEDKGWVDQAEAFLRGELEALGKAITEEALAELVSNTGPNLRDLHQEGEKVALYVGDRRPIEVADVAAVVTRHKQARAFALAEALGDRDLPRLLRTLDEEMWEMKSDKQKSFIGLLYGIITKVRTLLLVKELLEARLLQPEADYQRFKRQLESFPSGVLPDDKRYNPLAMNPYVLFRALPQTRRYTSEELVRAMDQLLTCNHRLVSSGLSEALLVQQTLVEIVQEKETRSQPTLRSQPRR